MIGALAATGMLPMRVKDLKDSLRDLVSAEYLGINMEAFELGFKALKT